MVLKSQQVCTAQELIWKQSTTPMDLGGRDFTVEDAKDVFAELADVVENGKPVTQYQYIGLRK